ncbi:protein hinderin [Betta splendens]|uniref:Protein hinderin n=1 Tax=Betta splendens TaxID=158456 RepID=A0A6P7MMF2_BETSP|nr:protein hinderin [Betta splendens]
MAAATRRVESSGIFWMNGASDDEQPLAYVPGVDTDLMPGSISFSSKGGTKTRTRRSAYKKEATLKKSSKTHVHLQNGSSIKEKACQNIAAAARDHTSSPTLETFLPPSQVISEASRIPSQVCLKDLCAEDKRRIANLIEELARVSEEKEESMQRLKEEQEKFECKIQQLEERNVLIAQERESLQQQYKECQELLGLYQQYLSQQQAKLNQSIAQVLSTEEMPSRTPSRKVDGSLFDGSYLSLQVQRSADEGRAVQTCSNPVSVSCATALCSTHGQTKPHRSDKRECTEPHSQSCQRCEQCQVQNSVYGTHQCRGCNGPHLQNGQQDRFNKRDCERLQSVNAMGLMSEETLTRPLLGHEDWEEKRHQLLLQKMQLETERERLQARLIEQEERLNRQHQQLHQTHLDYSRFEKATQPELSNSTTRTGEPQPEGPSHQDLPSSVAQDADLPPTDQHLHEKCSQPAPTLRDSGIHTIEIHERSRRDMATSPAKSPTSLSKPTSVSTTQKTPDARMDFSVVELLDMLSPVPAPEQSQLSTRRTTSAQRRPALTAPKAVCRSQRTPNGRYPQSSQQDLEESQILEDIFFIY